jgi:hypothetical protein
MYGGVSNLFVLRVRQHEREVIQQSAKAGVPDNDGLSTVENQCR